MSEYYESHSLIPAQYTWDLTSFYSSADDWEKEYQLLDQELSLISKFKGRLGESKELLLEALDLWFSFQRRCEKLYTFAVLQSDEDLSHGENLARRNRSMGLYSRLSSAGSYINPELLGLDQMLIDGWMKSEDLRPYRRILQEILRYRPHTLSAAEERLLAMGGEVFSAPRNIFGQLNNVDLQFGTVEVEGKSIPITHGSLYSLLQNPNRPIRKSAWEQYYREFERHKNTIAAAYSASVQKDVYLSQIRGHASALEAALFGDNVPTRVYHNLITSVRAGLPNLHRYYSYRSKFLGLAEQTTYDLYVPLIPETKTHISYEEACSILLEAFLPLGEEYCSILKNGLENERWVDVYESKGKRSGAYSSGCYDSRPYILMNYRADLLQSLFTLAHEAGHSMHTYFSKVSQPYQDHDYTIFVAEVASTLNEQLLTAYLLRKYASNLPMVQTLVNHSIEDIRSTVFTQTLYAEFELFVHGLVERHESISVDIFLNHYRSLQSDYFGSSVILPELAPLHCLLIPHFYSAFYVYKYATGIASAIALAEPILAGDTMARDKYLTFLRSGGTKHPMDLLRDAGVDLSSSAPIEATIGKFRSLMDILEKES